MWVGLFGFKEIRTRAGIAAGLIEVAAFGVLALAAITAGAARQADRPASPGARMRGRVQAAVSMVIGAVGARLGGRAWPCSASPKPTRPAHLRLPAARAVTLKTATIGGATVLTNAEGPHAVLVRS